MKNFFVSTPIYYPEDIPSVQTAYTTIAADCISRYHRFLSDDVYFITGLDEHGHKVQQAAKARRLTPQAYVDKAYENLVTVWQKLQVSFDFFIRTSDDTHIRLTEQIFDKLLSTGDIYRGNYSGWYCISCESFWPSPLIKKDRKCPNKECRGSVDEISEEGYFFKLSKYAERLLEYIENNPDFIKPERRRKKAVTLIERGLQDLCITRKGLVWGIPVPMDPNFTIYVWFDALAGYLTAAGYGTDAFKKNWPVDLQIIRKNILAFHSIIWPSFCFALDIPLPGTIFAHGAVNDCIRDKSGNRVSCVNLFEIIDEFGSDAFRYYLLRDMPFGPDVNFSVAQLEHRLNNDLANDLGNLFSRSISMIEKYSGGVIPESGDETSEEKELEKSFRSVKSEYKKSMDSLSFNEALESVMELTDTMNRYIDITAPWDLSRNNRSDRLNTVLYTVMDHLRVLCVMLYPFIPKASTKMWRQLGFSHSPRGRKFDFLNPGLTPVGQKIQRGGHLFPKVTIEEEKIDVH